MGQRSVGEGRGRRGRRGRAVFPLDRPLVSGVCGSRRVRKSFNPARTGARGGATRDLRGAHRDHGGIGHGGAGDVPLGSLRSGRGGEASAGPGSRGNGHNPARLPVDGRRSRSRGRSRAVARAAVRNRTDRDAASMTRESHACHRHASRGVTSPQRRAPSGAAKRFVGQEPRGERARTGGKRWSPRREGAHLGGCLGARGWRLKAARMGAAAMAVMAADILRRNDKQLKAHDRWPHQGWPGRLMGKKKSTVEI